MTITQGASPLVASTGAELAVQALADEGVEYLFNLPGNGVYPLLAPLAQHQSMRYVLGLHEASLVFMADGYARASGNVPFVNVYMMPGTANALASLYTAYKDRVPMVVTATQQKRSVVGRDAYASAPDLVGVARQFTKWCWEVTAPERLPEAIHRAFAIAKAPPQGPVYLTLPVDLLPARADAALTTPHRPTATPVLGPPSPDVVRDIAERLVAAERVLLVCGKDAVTCDATDEAIALAEELGAAAVSEPWTAAVAFPHPHPLGFGEYDRGIFDRLAPTVVLGIGARLFVEATNPEPPFPATTTTIALGVDPADLGSQQPVEVAAVCDLKQTVRAILQAVRGRVDGAQKAARVGAIESFQREIKAANANLVADHFDRRPMSLARLATELNRALDAETLLVEHATTSTGVLMSLLNLPRPANVFGTGGSVQGWGTPAAFGVQLARPDRRVLALVGDGGFTFTCQSLWTAGHYHLPATIIVLNNSGYRSMRGGVAHAAPGAVEAGVDFGFDFQVGVRDVARGFGVESQRIDDPSEVADAVRASLRADAPRVLEVMISPSLEFRPSRNTPQAL